MAGKSSAPASGIGGLFSSITGVLTNAAKTATNSVKKVANKTTGAVTNISSGTAANIAKISNTVKNLKNAANNTINGATTPAVVSPGVAAGNSNAGMTGAPPNLTNEKVNPTATNVNNAVGGRRTRTKRKNRNRINKKNRNRTNRRR